jgi:hypothetical protein
MLLLPDTIIDMLVSSGSVRLSTAGLMPATMEQYADAARRGGAHITFVVANAIPPPAVMQSVARIGQGHVTFDFVG